MTPRNLPRTENAAPFVLMVGMVKIFYPKKKAFTLVEVVIAMGLVTFSLVAMLGLLPMGLTTFRESMDATVEAQILSKVSADIAILPFDNLPDYAKSMQYFDNEGQRSESSEAIYHVEIETAIPKYPNKPSAIEADLINLQVKITSPRSRDTRKVSNLFIARSNSRQ